MNETGSSPELGVQSNFSDEDMRDVLGLWKQGVGGEAPLSEEFALAVQRFELILRESPNALSDEQMETVRGLISDLTTGHRESLETYVDEINGWIARETSTVLLATAEGQMSVPLTGASIVDGHILPVSDGQIVSVVGFEFHET